MENFVAPLSLSLLCCPLSPPASLHNNCLSKCAMQTGSSHLRRSPACCKASNRRKLPSRPVSRTESARRPRAKPHRCSARVTLTLCFLQFRYSAHARPPWKSGHFLSEPRPLCSKSGRPPSPLARWLARQFQESFASSSAAARNHDALGEQTSGKHRLRARRRRRRQIDFTGCPSSKPTLSRFFSPFSSARSSARPMPVVSASSASGNRAAQSGHRFVRLLNSINGRLFEAKGCRSRAVLPVCRRASGHWSRAAIRGGHIWRSRPPVHCLLMQCKQAPANKYNGSLTSKGNGIRMVPVRVALHAHNSVCALESWPT